jgi:SPP1 family predicted phage head-tail adaptor
MTAPGKMDERIEFFRKGVGADDGQGGEEPADPVLITTVWAEPRPLNGREVARFGVVNAESSAVFKIRNRQDLNEANFVKYRGDFYNIKHLPRPSPRVMYIDIVAERGVAQ